MTEPKGENCPSGGLRVETAGAAQFVCNGSPDDGRAVLAKAAAVDGAGSGLDSDLLDGLDSEQLQRRVTGSCDGGSIAAIEVDGGVSCLPAPEPVFSRTFVVHGSGTPVANGAALRAVVTEAAALSRTQWPAVVLIESGSYDLGGEGLLIDSLARVHLKGMSREGVRISANAGQYSTVPGTITFKRASGSVEQLTVNATSNIARGIFVTDDAVVSVRDTTVTANGTMYSLGLQTYLSASAASSTPTLTVERCAVEAVGGVATGIAVYDGSARVRESSISAVAGRAIEVFGGSGVNHITHTQLVGSVSGSMQCFGAYGPTLAARGSNCQ